MTFSPVVVAFVMTFLAGSALTVQVATNGVLSKASTGPLWAAFFSFLIGTLALLILLLILREPPPSMSSLLKLPKWYFFGGVLGVFYVTVVVMSIGVIGSVSLVTTVIVAQLITATVLEHFGVLGIPKNPVQLKTLIGFALMLAGFSLIK
ncbi:DMT family transporter [Glaciecola sp. 2405UD65-10]|uniref:DMT family transporter n=1 Tax=Glaciecola sp. 2405UD65-10 TaxID=3397244 RepID=UPI003B5A78DA